jgi:hypothetical protein
MQSFLRCTIPLLCLSALFHLLPAQDLLERLEGHQVSAFSTKDASVFRDPESRSLTFTFNYTQGEPEVRIPVAALGWPTDWSAFQAVQYTFSTTSLETVAIGFSDGNETKFFVTEPLPGIRIHGVIPFESFVQTRGLNPLRPLGYKVWPGRLFTFEKVEEVVFRMRYPSQHSQFTLYNFTLTADVPDDGIIDRKPLIDRYGQWIPENWEDKAHNDEQLRQLWEGDRLPPAEYPFCDLGGDVSRQLEAEGFFRTAQVDGKWVLVDPHGHPFFSTGMDLVGYDPSSFATSVTGREFMYQELPPPGPAWLTPDRVVSFYISNIMKRFGEDWRNLWTEHIVERLKNWGFNTIANWSSPEVAKASKMPYVLPIGGWTTKKVFPFPYNFPDVFSSEFEETVDAAARRQVVPYRDDPLLIGWFIGNEPYWARSFGALQSWPEMVLNDPEDSATKQKLQELLAANPGKEQQMKDDFLFTCAQRYFQVVTAAVRRHDPNHLVLGIRFAGRPHDRFVEMCSIFDVFSINIYAADFKPNAEDIRHYSQLSGKPVMIGEFTACAPGRGLQGLFYNVHKVRDYQERGKAYIYYVENSAADPHIIGTHWFQMVDDLPTGRPSDQERLNYGFINVIDLPYKDLVEAARDTHGKIYDLKFGKTQPSKDVPRYN